MNNGKTVLLTGAFGQVGHRCLEFLVRDGYNVIALDVDNEKNKKFETTVRNNLPPELNFIKTNTNLLDEQAVSQVIAQYAPRASGFL